MGNSDGVVGVVGNPLCENVGEVRFEGRGGGDVGGVEKAGAGEWASAVEGRFEGDASRVCGVRDDDAEEVKLPAS